MFHWPSSCAVARELEVDREREVDVVRERAQPDLAHVGDRVDVVAEHGDERAANAPSASADVDSSYSVQSRPSRNIAENTYAIVTSAELGAGVGAAAAHAHTSDAKAEPPRSHIAGVVSCALSSGVGRGWVRIGPASGPGY